MILKLTQIPDEAQDFKDGLMLLVNLDNVAAIHSRKITLKTPIIGGENEHWGSVVTLNNGSFFPVKESTDKIYEQLPYSIKRTLDPNYGSLAKSQVV